MADQESRGNSLDGQRGFAPTASLVAIPDPSGSCSQYSESCDDQRGSDGEVMRMLQKDAN